MTANPPFQPIPTLPRAATTRALALTLVLALGGCAHAPGSPAGGQGQAQAPVAVTDITSPISQRLHALGRPDVLMLGEQHDAPDHQRQHLQAVHMLASVGELAAVVLEMADAGHDTRALPAQASPPQVQRALAWRESAWPWTDYGPAIMAAVQAGVPVFGGNLPRQDNVAAMKDPAWDARVPPDVLAAQQEAVRVGHCNLLAPGQAGPMTRIQIARDVQLAHTVQAATARGQTVLLLTGSQHAHRQLGAPLHLAPGLRVKTVRLAADGLRPDDASGFDAVWTTPPLPPRDHCAAFTGAR